MTFFKKEKPLFGISDIKKTFNSFGYDWDNIVIDEGGRPNYFISEESACVLVGVNQFLVHKRDDKNHTPIYVNCRIDNNTFDFKPFQSSSKTALGKSTCVWLKNLILKNIYNEEYCEKSIKRIEQSASCVEDSYLKNYQKELARLLREYLEKQRIDQSGF